MSRPAILLDRDGTIIVERHYLSDPAGVTLERNTAAGLRALAAGGRPLVVLTNQSGIARGMFDAAAADAVDARVAELLAAEGVTLAATYRCPHGPDDDCPCRKPRPGLAHAAARDLDLDLARSVMIGDKISDMALARAIGARGLLVRTGHGATQDAGSAEVCNDLLAAARLLGAPLP